MAHQVRNVVDPSGHRVFFTDNFYTSHRVAKALKTFTDGEARLIGTVRLNTVDCTNRYHLVKAIEMIETKDRGSWALVQAYDESSELAKLQREYQASNRFKTKADKTPFVPPFDRVAEHAGYVVFKDAKVVTFYTNDLAGTPSAPIIQGCTMEAQTLVHGLETLHRWTGVEVMTRSKFRVPATIVAYNSFMNAVDRMDQIRSTNITQRREKRLHMTMWTMFLDLAIHNAYCIFLNSASGEVKRKHQSLSSFKNAVAKQLIQQQLDRKKKNEASNRSTSLEMNNDLGGIESSHMIVRNLKRDGMNKTRDVNCYLCKLRKLEITTQYCCAECKVGFHPKCFTAYHNKDALKGNSKVLVQMLRLSEEKGSFRKKTTKHAGSILTLELPDADSARPAKATRLRNFGDSDLDNSDSKEDDVEEV
jgi:hypothetical protein